MVLTEIMREQFDTDPAAFLRHVIDDYVTASPDNRLTALDNALIFDKPLVGFANGDDAIFQDYKKIIGDFHLTPREAMEAYLRDEGVPEERWPGFVSVVSWVLPVSRETRLSLRRESVVPSLRWNHTRWHGQDFIFELSHYVAATMERLGYQAMVPERASFFKVQELPSGRASNWSQRHIAYAAGLGTFSLSDGFITPRGIAMRCGSVVIGMALPATPRVYGNHLANCLFYRDGSCRRCIERCPAGAISEQGHDKKKCREFMYVEQKAKIKELGREDGYIGAYLGCGLCQTKVPCEAQIPPGISQ